jgi:hypothetical protein
MKADAPSPSPLTLFRSPRRALDVLEFVAFIENGC